MAERKRWLGTAGYGRFLIFVAGMGGLLYGIDVGIIAAALLYLGKTVSLTLGQTSAIVAAVLGGGMCSSLVAGVLADWLGRKAMMIASGVIFVASVGLIVASQSFAPLLLGRLLQGASGGVIAVVVPLYLAETLGADNRGRGTAFFQFMLTVGIVAASLTGWFYTRQAEAAIAAAAGNAALVRAAAGHAWRGMFLSVIYPGLLFLAGSCALTDTPRWLARRGRRSEALQALRRVSGEGEAQANLAAIEALALDDATGVRMGGGAKAPGSLLRRKYVVPFALACVVLACNQATGINSILGFLVVILKQAGMSASHATQGDVAVKALNCLMTLVAIALVDRKGRRFLLKLGTGGIVVALVSAALLFRGIESQRVDVAERVRAQAAAAGGGLAIPVDAATLGPAIDGRAMALTVLYSQGGGDRVATALSSDADPVVRLGPGAGIAIKRALYGPVPTERVGWMVTGCLGLFIAAFSVGPGVVVWLMLSELMPTRIRSTGMGIALLLNQGVSTLIAAVFLPVVGRHGYSTMFLFWAGSTAIYFLTAAFFLPETKGKTLEQVEMQFESGRA